MIGPDANAWVDQIERLRHAMVEAMRVYDPAGADAVDAIAQQSMDRVIDGEDSHNGLR